MKAFSLKITLAVLSLALGACSQNSSGGYPAATSTAMSFNLQGAELGECGLVSQFEKGRATSSQSAGGG